MAYAKAILDQLEAQRAYFASDDHIRREVEIWAGTTPEQRLAEVAAMCKVGDFYWSRIDPAAIERMQALHELPADTIAVLERVRRESR